MTLSKSAVKEFQAIYKARFGQPIEYKAAELEAMQLIRLLSKIQPRTELNMNMGINVSDQGHIPNGTGYGKHS
ncbi:MAG TPA: hypothetical protein VH234_05470 [Candidatus Saccharimonadales bacterium]|jgi:hypothetical protein|nr:hypothetical protein [Candidatus Saccharimonadales bacterium]